MTALTLLLLIPAACVEDDDALDELDMLELDDDPAYGPLDPDAVPEELDELAVPSDLGDAGDPLPEAELDWNEPPQIPILTQTELMQLVLGGSSYYYTSFHNPNPGGHSGVDIGGAGDGITTVRSPVTGTVTANTNNAPNMCGKVAVYDGSNTVIMAHMSNMVAPPVGSPITIGTAVGKVSKVVGNGCTATAAHLHLEIRTGNNTNMANPANNNVATTRDPLTYGYSPFSAVTLLSPSANASLGSSPITFSWAGQQGATSYRLQIATTNSFTSETCTYGCVYNSAASGTTRLVSLGIGTYYWRVRAGNSGQGGYWSGVRMVKRI